MKSKRLPAAERREVVLTEARKLFGARGYDGTTLDDVAGAAGVTKPIVYRHFASKQGLYLALLERHRDDLPTFFEGVEFPAEGDFLPQVLDRWFDYVRKNSHSWLMLFRDAGGDAEIRARRASVSVEARKVIANVIALRGAVAPERIRPTAEFITSGLAGVALWWIDNPDVAKPLLVAVAADMLAPALPAS